MTGLSTVPVLGRLVRRAALAVEWRIDERLEQHLAPLRVRLDELESQVERLETRLGDEHGRFAVDLEAHFQAIQRMAPQLAAVEVRLADTGDDAATAGDDTAAARREHERARVRLAALASYEERLQRLEAAADAADVQVGVR